MAEFRVEVTDHALARWRERGAEYADAPAEDLARAFCAAAVVPDDEPLPAANMNRLGGVQWYKDAGGLYYLTRRPVADELLILTVVRPGWEPTLVPKRKKRPAAPQWDANEDAVRVDLATATIEELKAERSRLGTRYDALLAMHAHPEAVGFVRDARAAVQERINERARAEQEARRERVRELAGVSVRPRRAIAVVVDLVEAFDAGADLGPIMVEARALAACAKVAKTLGDSAA
jgi:hypothetical protein